MTKPSNDVKNITITNQEELCDEQGLDELINELEHEGNEDTKEPKNSIPESFGKNLKTSIFRKRKNNHYLLQSRFQKLAGIKIQPAAILTVGKTKVELSELPPWYDVVRYKICGFKYEVVYPY